MNNNTAIKVSPGQKSDKAGIYRCDTCGNLHAMLEKETASDCEICREDGKSQQWIKTKKELMIVTKNVKQEVERRKTRADRMSDAITDFCGNVHFVYVQIVWFAVWLIYNSVVQHPFDPYPFGTLTMVVSLEAILLSTFILISQNRQGEIQELRSELDYQTDMKSEKNTAEILALLKKIYEETREGDN